MTVPGAEQSDVYRHSWKVRSTTSELKGHGECCGPARILPEANADWNGSLQSPQSADAKVANGSARAQFPGGSCCGARLPPAAGRRHIALPTTTRLGPNETH
jgi:hypothetical protein